MNPKVDWFFLKDTKWQKEYKSLRKIALSCDLTETLKWGCPCYTFDKKNIVLIHGFKDYCAFLFFKGVLLKDKKKILIQQTKNVQVARQIRFTNVREIEKMRATLKTYIYEAAQVEALGLKPSYKETSEFNIPEELQAKWKKSAALKRAFHELTPGRQRGYLFYFSQPKQSKTRESRIEKFVPRIMEGKGMED